MNYLAHIYFSNGVDDIIVGNAIGDFVKGILHSEDFPKLVLRGLELHRSIDIFSDQHIALAKAKNFFREEYRLYSGAIVDVVMDYYLANDPRYFPNEQALKSFTEKAFEAIDRRKDILPANYKMMYNYMKSENWLYQIRTLKGLEIALHRLGKKIGPDFDASHAYLTVVQHYYELNQIYYEFIEDFEPFVKSKLN